MAQMEVVVPRYHVTEFYIVRYFSCMSFLCLMQNRKRQVSGYQECLHLGRHEIMTTFAFSNPKQWRKKRLQVHTRHKFQCIPIANSIPKHCFQYTVAKLSNVAKQLGSFFKIHWFLKRTSFLVSRLTYYQQFGILGQIQAKWSLCRFLKFGSFCLEVRPLTSPSWAI